VNVTLKDANGATATQQVSVKLTITKPCTISPNPTSLTFTAEQGKNNPNSQSFTVTSSSNNCTGTVTTNVTTDNGGSWLHADNGGTLGPSGQLGINVSVNTQGLSADSYTGHVNVTFKDANGVTNTQQVSVKLTISPQCVKSANQIPLTFNAQQGGTNPPSQNFTVTSQCTGTITTSVHTNNGGSWLSATGGGQITPSSQLVITVSVNTNGMPAGQYTGYVKVILTEPNGVTDDTYAQANITLKIQEAPTPTPTPPPCITVNPPSLSFSAHQGYNPGAQSFTVTNCGDTGTVTTSVSTDESGPWLSTTGGGQLNAQGQLLINVIVNSQNMAAGTYTGHVLVTLKYANGLTTTQQVNVSLYIEPPPSAY
jgi:hypothetical protein